MKLKPQAALAVTLVIFILGIAITSAAGLYQTTTDKNPGTIEVAGQGEQYDPAGIRGSYTFSDVSRLYGIGLEELTRAFGLDGAAASTKVSALGALYDETEADIGPPSVRLFVAYYLGLPYTPVETAFLPKPAAELLISRGTLTPEQIAFVEAHTLSD